MLWLYYTASAQARDSSCGCSSSLRGKCHRYSCDMGFDIFWAVLWTLSFILVCAGRAPGGIPGAFFSAVMIWLFIATAVLSSKVRKGLWVAHAANTLRDVECIGINTAPAGQSAVPGVERTAATGAMLNMSHLL